MGEETKVGVKLKEIQEELNCPKNQYNKFGKYKYRSCEDIIEAVKKVAIPKNCYVTISDRIVEVCGRVYVEATASLICADDIGISISTTGYARESKDRKGMDDAQITGATSSYARKYALNGLFAIDDTKDADAGETKAIEYDDKGDNALFNKYVLAFEGVKSLDDIKSLWVDINKDKDKLSVDQMTVLTETKETAKTMYSK